MCHRILRGSAGTAAPVAILDFLKLLVYVSLKLSAVPLARKRPSAGTGGVSVSQTLGSGKVIRIIAIRAYFGCQSVGEGAQRCVTYEEDA